MINCIIVSDSSLVRQMLEGILDTERDLRIAWSGDAQSLRTAGLVALPAAVAVVCVDEVAHRDDISALLTELGMRIVFMEAKAGSIESGATPDTDDRGRVCLPSPFGHGVRAWRELRPVLLDTIRRLAAGKSPDCPKPAGDADEVGERRPHRVLVVDDEKSLQRTLLAFLKRAGYDAEAMEDPESALEATARTSFDVVLSDLILPGWSGMALLEEIKKRSPETQVILMTGRPTDDSAVEAERLGAFDYLAKPFSREAMLDSVARAVRSRCTGRMS